MMYPPAALLSLLLGCPFCEAPSLTLSEQLTGSDVVVLARWIDADRGGAGRPAFTRYLVEKSVKGPYKPGKKLKLAGYQTGKDTETVLLTAGGGQLLQWDLPTPISADGFDYLMGGPKPDAPTLERLRYYVRFLEHPDELVASDAYGEFANAPFEEIEKLAPDLPRQKIVGWLGDEDTDPARLALFGLLLGLCGTDEDAKLLEEKVFGSDDPYRMGVDGMLSGYLLLTRESGLEVLEAKKLKPRSEEALRNGAEKIPFSEVYAGMQAVRFMWTYGGDRIGKDRLRQSMRLLLDRPEIAEVVVADLARWNDWDAMDRVVKLFGKKEFDIPAVKRSIVRYLLEAKKSPEATDAQKKRAVAALADLKKKDAKLVENVKRYLFLDS